MGLRLPAADTVVDEDTELWVDGNSVLKAVVHLGQLRLARLPLKGSTYVNKSNERGETALMVACNIQHADMHSSPRSRMVRYLLEQQPDPKIQDIQIWQEGTHLCLHVESGGR